MSILSDQFFRQMAANKVGIAEFSESDEFCGFRLYPRQQVLLKLFFLEEMEGWEEDVLSEWIRGEDGVAISPKVRERRDYLRDQGYSHFTEIQLIGGRRGSKGFMTALAMAKVMYEVQQIPNPGEFFNVAKTKEIYFTCVAASLDQAKKFQFADLISVVSNCKPLLPNITSIMEEGFNIKTDADEELVRELRAEGVPVSRDYAKLRAKPLPANARSVRGATSLVSVFDEFAHMMEGKSASTGSEVYNANKPSLAQFGKWGMLFLNSSPWAKTGKFYEQTEIGFALDEDGNPFNNSILTFQWPSWAIYKDYDKDPRKQRWSHAPIPNAVMANPDVPDEGQVCEDDIIKARELRLEEKANPESFSVEYRANWAEVMDGYFNPTAVDRAFSGLIHIPSKDIPGLEEDILRPVRMATNGSYNHEYRMHLDPSSTTAGYGMALGHVEEFPNPNFNGEMVSHVVIDFVKRWNPDDFPQGTIDPMEVSREVLHLIDIFRPSEVTYDQYQSDMPIQWLREEMQKKGIHETKVYKSQGNNRENWNKWETLKTAMNLGMFHVAPDCPDSDYAKQELKFLSCDRNKQNPVVDRQKTGPIQTKDMSDAQRDICYSFLGKFLFDIVSKRGNAEIRTGAQGGYQIGGRQQGGPQSMSSGRYDINDFYKDRSMRGGPSNPARGIRRSRR